MRLATFIILLGWISVGYTQVYEEPSWIPPLPPPVQEYCGDVEKVSEPVLSYRISPACEITEVQTIGEYQYGVAQVKREILGFSSKEMIKKYVSDEFRLFNEVKIDLHRSMEPTATLVCTVEMLGNSIIDARILRSMNNSNTVSYKTEQLIIEDGKLPNLGVFTYTTEVRYIHNNCPEHLR